MQAEVGTGGLVHVLEVDHCAFPVALYGTVTV